MTKPKWSRPAVAASCWRRVSIRTLERANELGFDFVCLTGNPGTGVSNASIAHSVRVVKEHFNGLVIAGKSCGPGG